MNMIDDNVFFSSSFFLLFIIIIMLLFLYCVVVFEEILLSHQSKVIILSSHRSLKTKSAGYFFQLRYKSHKANGCPFSPWRHKPSPFRVCCAPMEGTVPSNNGVLLYWP